MIIGTPLQNLKKVHRELWSTIHLLGSVERQIVRTSKAWVEVVDVENVLRTAVGEVERIWKQYEGQLEKPLNIRQAEEFALKAQIAKAGEVAPAHRQLCRDDQSHK